MARALCVYKGMTIPIPWQDRFIPEPNSGCWLWDGALTRDGYGQVRIRNVNHRVHRLVWEESFGPIPEGMLICHTCDIPTCGNPSHLFLGTPQDNTRDMMAKGRFKGRSWLNAQKTHCPKGHEYTERNTMTFNGMRSCRQCMNERAARYYKRKRS